MALDPNFNDQEHLQSVIRQWMNREVREYFSDLTDWETDPDITTPRGSLRQACTHGDDDSLLMTALRWQLFERIRRQLFDVPYYGLPVSSFQESRRFQPQIKLFFQEDWDTIEPGYTPVTGEIGFRLPQYTTATVTQAVADQLAQRVRSAMATNNGRIWRKGKIMAAYSDWGKGYQLQLLSRTETDARTLITAILDINQDSPDWSKLTISENSNTAAAYPTIPPTEQIYGKTQRAARRRPTADVRFMAAFLHLHGLPNPVVLVDRTGTHPTALVSV